MHAIENEQARQQELFSELKAHKKTLTKQVKSLQAQVEREKQERDAVKAEYEQLLSILNKVKGME